MRPAMLASFRCSCHATTHLVCSWYHQKDFYWGTPLLTTRQRFDFHCCVGVGKPHNSIGSTWCSRNSGIPWTLQVVVLRVSYLHSLILHHYQTLFIWICYFLYFLHFLLLPLLCNCRDLSIIASLLIVFIFFITFSFTFLWKIILFGLSLVVLSCNIL